MGKYKNPNQTLPEGVTIINKDELAALRAELARVEKQRDEALAALQDAKSLILGYRAGGDKEVTKRVIAPIDTAITNATKKGN